MENGYSPSKNNQPYTPVLGSMSLVGNLKMRASLAFLIVAASLSASQPTAAQNGSKSAQPTTLTAAEAAALGAQPIGSVGGHYTVKPTGIYGTIETAKSAEMLDALRGPSSKDVEHKMALIQAHSGDYIPPVLMQMAINQFDAGKLDSAVFWFNAGLLRTLLDVRLSSDPSTASTPTDMIRRTPLKLVKAAISDDPKTSAIVQQVVSWDAKTPYNYDHRWVALHGGGATLSALDPASAPTTLTLPQEQWTSVIENNRAFYPSFVVGNAARVKAAQN